MRLCSWPAGPPVPPLWASPSAKPSKSQKNPKRKLTRAALAVSLSPLSLSRAWGPVKAPGTMLTRYEWTARVLSLSLSVLLACSLSFSRHSARLSCNCSGSNLHRSRTLQDPPTASRFRLPSPHLTQDTLPASSKGRHGARIVPTSLYTAMWNVTVAVSIFGMQGMQTGRVLKALACKDVERIASRTQSML